MNKHQMADRLLDIGARSLLVSKALPKDMTGKHVALQLFRSATSAGANYSEACGAESGKDFSHKLQIVLKELRETDYWLKLIIRSKLLAPSRLKLLQTEVDELIAICVSSVKTMKDKMISGNE